MVRMSATREARVHLGRVLPAHRLSVAAQAVERRLQSMGYRVARNAPYAGGYTTEHYGRPGRKVHALQVEVNRALYLDEARLVPTANFSRLKGDLEQLFATLATVEWEKV